MAESTMGPQKATRPVSLLASCRLDDRRAGASSSAGGICRVLGARERPWLTESFHQTVNKRFPGARRGCPQKASVARLQPPTLEARGGAATPQTLLQPLCRTRRPVPMRALQGAVYSAFQQEFVATARSAVGAT